MSRFSGFSFIAALAAAGLVGGCQTVERSTPVAPVAQTMSVDPLIGKWGLGAYHRDTDRPRTEKEARAQCSNPYVISKGPNGGVMIHLADEKERTEVVLKSAGGKTYLGPAGEAPLAEDREVVSIEPKLMIMRYVDPDVMARYGTSIYVRCGA